LGYPYPLGVLDFRRRSAYFPRTIWRDRSRFWAGRSFFAYEVTNDEAYGTAEVREYWNQMIPNERQEVWAAASARLDEEEPARQGRGTPSRRLTHSMPAAGLISVPLSVGRPLCRKG
jgi:hypothetical protein